MYPPGKNNPPAATRFFPIRTCSGLSPETPTATPRIGNFVTFKKGTNNKTADVRIRFTPDEKEQAKSYAKEGGLNLSEYIRRRAIGLPVRSKSDTQMINELRKIGGLVKHIHNQTAGAYSKETSDVLVQITEAIKRIEG